MRQPIRPTLPAVFTALHTFQPVAHALTSTALTTAGFFALSAPSLVTGPS